VVKAEAVSGNDDGHSEVMAREVIAYLQPALIEIKKPAETVLYLGRNGWGEFVIASRGAARWRSEKNRHAFQTRFRN
jgi:hypothetical protein